MTQNEGSTGIFHAFLLINGYTIDSSKIASLHEICLPLLRFTLIWNFASAFLGGRFVEIESENWICS
jgi:hypothetical protein